MAGSIMESLRDAFDNLTDREQKLVALLGVVVVVLVIGLPVYLMGAGLSEMEAENDALRDVMREIDQARPRLARLAAERDRNRALFANEAPALAGFVEQAAAAEELALREINDQPELAMSGYMRRGVRVRMPDVGIMPVLDMLKAIEDSGHPVAIGRLQIDRYRTEGNFNVQVGVRAYDVAEGGADEAGSSMRGGRGGMR